MKAHAVIDTNVLVSSLLSQNNYSPTKLVIAAIYAGELIPIVNPEIMSEYRDVLNRKKFSFDNSTISDLLEIFKVKGLMSNRTLAGIPLPDVDDLVFYETYLSVTDAYLITGNLKHFPVEKRIVSPADMAQILCSDHGDIKVLNEPTAAYISDNKRQIISRSLEAFERLRVQALANGTSGMSLDEINEEIRQYREEKSRQRS